MKEAKKMKKKQFEIVSSILKFKFLRTSLDPLM